MSLYEGIDSCDALLMYGIKFFSVNITKLEKFKRFMLGIIMVQKGIKVKEMMEFVLRCN